MKKNVGIVFGVVVGITVLCLLVWCFFSIHFVDKHELGFTFDRFTGEVAKVQHTGWVFRGAVRYSVNTIDLRPYQVSITADLNVGSRILNAKLVRFNPEGLEMFIAWHGRKAGNSVDALKEILKCYAFDRQNGTDCPFLTIISEISPDQGEAVTK